MGALKHKSKDGASPPSNKDLLPLRPCTGCLRQPCRGEGFLQAAVLLHLPGCQFCIYNILHLWRILLEHNIDLRSDLPGSLSKRSLQPTKALTSAEKPLERGFFRFACYSTCQAASFASTTSCTFGGFFWSTTLTCAQIFPVLAANQG